MPSRAPRYTAPSGWFTAVEGLSGCALLSAVRDDEFIGRARARVRRDHRSPVYDRLVSWVGYDLWFLPESSEFAESLARTDLVVPLPPETLILKAV